MGWLIVIGVLVVLGCLPIGIGADYYENGPTVHVVIGPIRFRLYPRTKSEKKKKEKTESAEKKFASHAQAKKKRGGKLTDFLPILNLILDFLVDFRHKLRVRKLEFKLILAGDDPCDLSIQYGNVWALLGSFLPLLERAFVIQKQNIEVECDYTVEESLIEGSVEIVISLARLLWIALFHGTRILVRYYKIMKFTKDGAAI